MTIPIYFEYGIRCTSQLLSSMPTSHKPEGCSQSRVADGVPPTATNQLIPPRPYVCTIGTKKDRPKQGCIFRKRWSVPAPWIDNAVQRRKYIAPRSKNVEDLYEVNEATDGYRHSARGLDRTQRRYRGLDCGFEA